jgi:hypothetical protein
MTLPDELRTMLLASRFTESDRRLIKRAIEELERLEGKEAKDDAHEKEAFEKAFPEVTKHDKQH